MNNSDIKTLEQMTSLSEKMERDVNNFLKLADKLSKNYNNLMILSVLLEERDLSESLEDELNKVKTELYDHALKYKVKPMEVLEHVLLAYDKDIKEYK